MKAPEIIKRLVWLSRELGREDRQLAILGEGNVSADLGDGTFYVKASGSSLATMDAGGFTRVKTAPVLAALGQPGKTDEEIRIVLESCRLDKEAKLPSVETFLHAICLREGGAKWVGHTHPVSVLENPLQQSWRGAVSPPYFSGCHRGLRPPSRRGALR